MAEFEIQGPFREKEVVDIFAKEGIQYKTRNERYKLLNNTMFEKTNGGYWISFSKGKPIAVQGIGLHNGIYLLLGLVSHGADYKGKLDISDTKGAGSAVSNKVIDLHGDKPIVGMAKPAGKRLFSKVGFKDIEIENGNVVGQEDIPQDVKDVIEQVYSKGVIPNEVAPIRKLYFKPISNWFYIMQRR